MDKLFSEWLQDQLNSRGWSQSDLARKSGLSRQVISRYVNQKRLNPDEEMLAAIARAFGYPPEVIFRAAGLLPPLPDRNAIVEEILEYKLAELDDEQLDDILAYIEFVQAKAKTSQQKEKENKFREGIAPPEVVKKK